MSYMYILLQLTDLQELRCQYNYYNVLMHFYYVVKLCCLFSCSYRGTVLEATANGGAGNEDFSVIKLSCSVVGEVAPGHLCYHR